MAQSLSDKQAENIGKGKDSGTSAKATAVTANSPEVQGPRTADPIRFGQVKSLDEARKDQVEKETGKRPEDLKAVNDPVGASDLRTAVMDVVNKEFAARGLQVPVELTNIVTAVANNAAQGHYKVPVGENVDPMGNPRENPDVTAKKQTKS